MKEFLSIKEVADYLGVDYKTIYRLVQQAEIPAGKVGGVYRIRRTDVESYFERQRQALVQEATHVTMAKCGRCLRLLAPAEIAGLCEAPDCEEPLCSACWQDDPDHRCRQHLVGREARLRQAQAQQQRGEIPLLLTSFDASRRQLMYLSRLEAKLRSVDRVPHPLTQRAVKVADWGAVETRLEELERIREAVGSAAGGEQAGGLPTNPRLSYRLARDLVLEAVVYSDLASHLKQGFVTRTTSMTELFELLSRAIGRAEASSSLTVFGLAATAGWDEEAVTLIRGNGAGERPFHHRLVAPVLIDLAKDTLVYNQTDNRLLGLAPLFSPEMAMDVVQALMANVEALFRLGRTAVMLNELAEQKGVSAEVVGEAFDRLAAGKVYQVIGDKADRTIVRRQV